ncbi:TAFII28-domain-containing protein [Pholiota conissans]|uniref:Transcription initiation factor TFIID subunit 11 n=1 Tax=Pholiota conissans TaxID=109636 RepID=A0A9P5YWT4_9AGAR|nr:TAFII28-domain-containing protein [Pholiota conissans]
MTTPYYNSQSIFSINPANPKTQTFTAGSLPSTPTPAGRGRPRGAATGAKRGRKPKGTPIPGAASPLAGTNTFASTSTSTAASFATPNANAQYPRVHWAMPNSNMPEGDEEGGEDARSPDINGGAGDQDVFMSQDEQADPKGPVIDPVLLGVGGTVGGGAVSQRATPIPIPDLTAGLILPNRGTPQPPLGTRSGTIGVDDEVEGDDELLPAMADDDYSAQLSWQSQSKDNLKVLMDNLSPDQYDRFEAYRRHALPKQAVRKVIQQTLGQQVSQPVAQIIAGFSKVFVGEIVEKARAVQTRRGENGPLSPDHLREAYRAYQEETGRVGAARPLRAKKLFVR